MPAFAADNATLTPDSLTPYSRMDELEASLDDPSVPVNTDDHSRLEYRTFRNLVNNVIAGIEGTLAWRHTPADGTAAPTRRAFALLLAAVFLAGAASLVYEVVWIRQLGMSLGSTAIASSVMLSSFLAGLALGSWISGRRADAAVSPLRSLVRIELFAALVGALSVPVLEFAGRAYVYLAITTAAGPAVSLGLRALFSIIVILVPATLFGMTFPLATAAAAPTRRC